MKLNCAVVDTLEDGKVYGYYVSYKDEVLMKNEKENRRKEQQY